MVFACMDLHLVSLSQSQSSRKSDRPIANTLSNKFTGKFSKFCYGVEKLLLRDEFVVKSFQLIHVI